LAVIQPEATENIKIDDPRIANLLPVLPVRFFFTNHGCFPIENSSDLAIFGLFFRVGFLLGQNAVMLSTFPQMGDSYATHCQPLFACIFNRELVGKSHAIMPGGSVP
jgi:hypothetical protein